MAGLTVRETKAIIKAAKSEGYAAEVVKPDGTVVRLFPAVTAPEKIKVDDPRRRHL